MKRYLILAVAFNLICIPVFSEDKDLAKEAVAEKDLTLAVVESGLGNYRGKELHLHLRLKNADLVMEKIWFYDTENVDIVFDLTGYEKDQKLSDSMVDAHPGVVYDVICIPESMSRGGVMTGKLISFEPLFLEKIQ
jgi:hypothetical protein